MHFTTRFWFASQPQKWTLHKYKPNASVHFYYLPHFQLNQHPSKKKKNNRTTPECHLHMYGVCGIHCIQVPGNMN